MDFKVISIIVPCFNQGIYLSETLESVMAQTYKFWECIIVDDGSTDHTAFEANKYLIKDSRFKYLYQNNRGVSCARNLGIEQSNGYYILPLDADDLIHQDYLLKAIEVFSSTPEIKLVYCNSRKFGEEQCLWQLPEYNYRNLLISNSIFCSALFKKKEFMECGMYDCNMLDGLEDWELWIRLLDETAIVKKLKDVFFFYRIKTRSRNKLSEKKNEDLRYTIYLKHVDIYKKHFANPMSILEENRQLISIYKNSYDYKLGFILLKPLRFISAIFKGNYFSKK